jgi:hypothetical protein
MNKIILIIIGIFLIIYGIYSIYIGFKGGPLLGFMSTSDTFIPRKILGEKRSNSFINIFMGIIEILFGVIILLGKFF